MGVHSLNQSAGLINMGFVALMSYSDLLYIAGGLVLLVLGGEGALRGAIGIAQKLNVSKAMIGLIVVGFGTSAPELTVTVQAALNQSPDLAIGNVVGSNIANILLILGVGGLICPMTTGPAVVRRDLTATVGAFFLLTGLSLYGVILMWHGFVMVALLIAYLVWSYRMDKKDATAAAMHELEVDELDEAPSNPFLIALYTIGGLAGLIFGADLMVTGAIGIARDFGISEAIIGLTIVAIGTSLPELAATVIAAVRGHTDVAVANIMGSLLFNILSILGITALIAPLPFPADIAQIDIWVMLAAGLILVPMLRKDHHLCRKESALLLIGYVCYMVNIAYRL